MKRKITHKHHIIPKHMGGTDNPDNLVELSVEDHAEAHRKLYEQYGKLDDKRAWLGLAGIMDGEDILYDIITAPKSEEHKRNISRALAGKKKPWMLGNKNASGKREGEVSQETRARISASKTGKRRPDMIGNTLASAGKGKKKSPEHIAKISLSNSKPETIAKKSAAFKETWKNKEAVICPHCGMQSKNVANMTRYHFEKCKKKENK